MRGREKWGGEREKESERDRERHRETQRNREREGGREGVGERDRGTDLWSFQRSSSLHVLSKLATNPRLSPASTEELVACSQPLRLVNQWSQKFPCFGTVPKLFVANVCVATAVSVSCDVR